MTFYFSTEIQTIMDKSLGTNLHLWRFFTRIHLHLFSPSFPAAPSPPPSPTASSYNVGHMYTLFLQSFNIVFGGVGGGEKATHFETHNSAFLKLRFKTTEN